MTKVPDRGDLALGCRVLGSFDAGPIVAAGTQVDERPAEGTAELGKPEKPGRAIVVGAMPVLAHGTAPTSVDSSGCG